ncbi:hypothetical protein AOLI_G00163090 [Acnodon oligacanthus]
MLTETISRTLTAPPPEGSCLLFGSLLHHLLRISLFHYDQLLMFSQDLSLQAVIYEELAQFRIHSFSFIDVVFEAVVLGILGGARPQIFLSPGGFLGHLMVMIFSFTPASTRRNPSAQQCFFLLQVKCK